MNQITQGAALSDADIENIAAEIRDGYTGDNDEECDLRFARAIEAHIRAADRLTAEQQRGAFEAWYATVGFADVAPDMAGTIKRISLQSWRAALTAQPQAEPAEIGTLTVSMFRGHLENRDFDYTGNLPDGTYRLFAAPTAPTEPTVWPMRGVRVDGDTVVISVKGGNDAARWLCGELVALIDRRK